MPSTEILGKKCVTDKNRDSNEKGKGSRCRREAYGSHEAAERAGPPGSRSRTRAGGAAAKAAGIAKALGDLRGERERVRVGAPGSTEASRSAGQRRGAYLAVLALELLELAADVLRRLLRRGGHRLAEKGFGFGCAGIGLVRRCARDGSRFGCPNLGCGGGALVSSSLRRWMTHRSAKSNSRALSGSLRFSFVAVAGRAVVRSVGAVGFGSSAHIRCGWFERDASCTYQARRPVLKKFIQRDHIDIF